MAADFFFFFFFFFFFQLLYQHGFKVNSSDILFYSSSIAVLSEPIFGWEVEFILFSETPHMV